jgi:hypothetical protein
MQWSRKKRWRTKWGKGVGYIKYKEGNKRGTYYDDV